MDAYDPLKAPSIAGWIELDESERLDLVLAYHQKQDDEIPSQRAHAAAHVMVENQLALAEEAPVASVLDRLMQEGLDRHDAIHAIGSVLMGFSTRAAQGKSDADPTPIYYRELMLADAILDRLVHNAHKITLKGDSMRKHHAKRLDDKPAD